MTLRRLGGLSLLLMGGYLMGCHTQAVGQAPAKPASGKTPESARTRVEVPPFGMGAHPVAMSNLELSERGSAIAQDDLERYLQGFRDSDGTMHDIQDLLADRKAVQTVLVSVPTNAKLYGACAGTKISVPYYVAYPTTADNARGEYLFPFKAAYAPTFVHFERAGDEPLPAKVQARYPVIVSSHGYTSHPAWDINRAKVLASHGFFVVLPLYGDGRFAPTSANDLPLRAIRSLATKALLDHVSKESPYAAFLDIDRVGISGYSLGGVTALTMLGAPLDLDADTVADPRVRAGIGIVPYTGSNEAGKVFYQFGPKNAGARNVTKPFLCIYGSSDTVASPGFILPTMSQLRGPRYVVEFVNQPHVFTGQFWFDRENWEILFFRAYLQEDARALELLRTADAIAGFGDDRQHFELQRAAD